MSEMLEKEERPSSDSIKFALEDAVSKVECAFSILTDEVLRYGFVHLKLAQNLFLVSDEETQISYVVEYYQIKWIQFMK